MKTVFTGKVFKFGDNIDTDILAPGMTISFGCSDGNELENVKLHAFEEIRKDFWKEVEPGSILVAGRNFGFGSHREQATTVISYMGFSAIVADSVARLYQRNSLAVGLPVIEAPGITSMVQEGDELSVDIGAWEIRNLTTGKSMKVEPLSDMAMKLIEAGGIIPLMKQQLGMDSPSPEKEG